MMPAVPPPVLRLSAFTDTPEGGNPAGVVLGAGALDAAAMLAIAAELGYSETAFLQAHTPAADADGARHFDVRYFSPEDEVPFCGHATIAAAVAVAQGEGGSGSGALVFHLGVGDVTVDTSIDARGAVTATLQSIAPEVLDVGEADVAEALGLLRWSPDDLEPALPPRIAFAGARHLILAAATRERLADLDYDFDGLRAFMLARDLITVDLVWRQDATTFAARNPFPVGGVVEDPATGAAAAAFGAYLRAIGAVQPPVRLTILQGHDMGRPSELLVDVAPEAERPGIRVTGRAVVIPG